MSCSAGRRSCRCLYGYLLPHLAIYSAMVVVLELSTQAGQALYLPVQYYNGAPAMPRVVAAADMLRPLHQWPQHRVSTATQNTVQAAWSAARCSFI